MKNRVFVERCSDYSSNNIEKALDSFDDLFAENIKPGEIVVLKPNWIAPHHKYNPDVWEPIITHPNFITGVIKKVLEHLKNSGKIIIADAPQTDSSFNEIIAKMPLEEWKKIGNAKGIEIEVLDLRDHEWVSKGDLTIARKKLPGDPLGSVDYNLGNVSEFDGHNPSSKGYYGADYNIQETTLAHTNGNHIYRLSRTVIKADVFINLPKMKTHKKAGISCSLKNLVGINTYKNFLPHHTEGTPSMGGDQFPNNNLRNVSELILLQYFKNFLLRYEKYSRYMIPIKRLGRILFGETKNTIRSGNWYGNDTLWRTILDINKLLLYGNPDGSLKEANPDHRKKYISFIDGIISGKGNGPEACDSLNSKIIIGGNNPVSVDCVAAKLMGFDYLKIPSIANAFKIRHLPIVDFSYGEIEVFSKTVNHYNASLLEIPKEKCFHFRPHFGWIGHIESH